MDDVFLVTLGALAVMGAVAWLLYRRHKVLVTFVTAQGWHWVGSKGKSLPAWLLENPILLEGMEDRTRVSFRNIFSGTYEGTSLLGFNRVSRRRGSSGSPLSEHMLCLYLPSLRHELPFVELWRAHAITNALVQFSEFVDQSSSEGMVSRPNIPGFENWVVRATPEGCEWLAEACGQHLAAGLSEFDSKFQSGFCMSGRLIMVRAPTFEPKHLRVVYTELQSFYRHITQAQKIELGT